MKKAHYYSFYLLFLCFSMLTSSAFAQKKKVACIGNSITEGMGVPDWGRYSYPTVLQEYLGTDEYEITNFGASGYTMLKGGRDFDGSPTSYWDHERYQLALNYQPDIVIIKLGTNDAKPINWNSLKEEYKTNYIEFIHSFQALESTPEIYVCYPIPLFGPGNWINDDRVMIEEMMPIIDEVAEETGVNIIDLHTPFEGKSYLSGDKVHLNINGYRFLAHLVANAICPECEITALPADLFVRIARFDRSDKSKNRSFSVNDEDISALFDKDADTSIEVPFTPEMWFSVELSALTKITAYSVTFSSEDVGCAPRSWVFQGSTDGINWTDIDEQKDIVFLEHETKSFDEFMTSYNALKNYAFYRFLITENNGSEYLSIAEWQLFGSEVSFEESLMDKGGKLTVQYSTISGEGPAYLVDKNVLSKYCTKVSGTWWIRYDLPVEAVVNRYSFTSANDLPERDPVSWVVYGSQDGNSWQAIDQQRDQLFGGRYSTMEYEVKTNKAFKVFRVVFSSVVSGDMFQLSEWQLYGETQGTGIKSEECSDMVIFGGKNTLRIVPDSDLIMGYEVYSVTGECLLKEKLIGEKEIERRMESGLYLIKLNTLAGDRVGKVVIK